MQAQNIPNCISMLNQIAKKTIFQVMLIEVRSGCIIRLQSRKLDMMMILKNES